MKEQGGNSRIRNLKTKFAEKATNLWNLVMRKNLLWTLLFIVYFCFQSFFERLLTDYLVLPFLSSFEATFFTRILFAVGVIYIIVRTSNAWKEKKQISPSHLYVSLLLILVWIYYRFISDAFSFTSVIFCIAFVDIIALYAISFWVIYLVPFLKKEDKIVQAEQEKTDVQKEQENNKVEEGFILDEPIHEDPKEDILKRSPFAESIANKLIKTNLSGGSLAIGITAPWGFGKTSFVNLIKYHIGDRAIVMDYSPWLYDKGSDLTQSFFAELSKKLSCYNHSLHHQIKAYVSMLGKTDLTLLQLFSSLYVLLHQDDSMEKTRDTLEKTLKSIPKPIVIVVDDLDRLIGDEIMEMMQLMRNGASFPNLCFIAAYDKDYIVKTIAEHNKTAMPTDYLAKIFQIEYAIPQFEKDVLRKVLLDSCSKFIANDDKAELHKAIDEPSGFRDFMIDELKSIRDVKRFVNALHASYPHLKGEIVLKDLMNITILKVKYKEVYDLLAKYRFRLFQKNHYGALELYNGSDEEKRKQKEESQPFEPKEQINLQQDWNIYFGNIYTEVQKKDILFLLEKIFSKYSDDKELRGVNTENGFERYFYDTLLEEDYSAKELANLWSLPLKEIKENINDALSTKSLSLHTQLKNFKPKDKVTFEKWISAILYIGTKSGEFNFIIDHNDLLKILDIPSFYKNNPNGYSQFLYDTFLENGPSLYLCQFLKNLEETQTWQLDAMSKLETRSIRLEMFKSILAQKNVSHELLFEFWQSMESVDYIDKDDSIYRTDEERNTYQAIRFYLPSAIAFYRDYAKHHIMAVLVHTISLVSRINGDRYGINKKIVYEIWGPWEEFEQFVYKVAKQNQDSKALMEYIDFMKQYKESIWQPIGIDYEFKYIDVKHKK